MEPGQAAGRAGDLHTAMLTPGWPMHTGVSSTTYESKHTMTTFASFPMTVQALHTTGANIVRCPALGTQQVFITDCFGNFVEAPCVQRLMHAIEGNGSH